MTQTAEFRRLTRLAAGFRRKTSIGAYNNLSPSDLWDIEHESDHCAYCGIGLEVGQGSFDHVIPLARWGPNTKANVVRSCFTCNRAKFTKTPAQHAQYQTLIVDCAVCGKEFKPRFGDWQRGGGRVCSRRCSALLSWQRAEVGWTSPSSSPVNRRPSITRTDRSS